MIVGFSALTSSSDVREEEGIGFRVGDCELFGTFELFH
jgi:hypothetical protein